MKNFNKAEPLTSAQLNSPEFHVAQERLGNLNQRVQLDLPNRRVIFDRGAAAEAKRAAGIFSSETGIRFTTVPRFSVV